jgi:hypothetical protein
MIKDRGYRPYTIPVSQTFTRRRRRKRSRKSPDAALGRARTAARALHRSIVSGKEGHTQLYRFRKLPSGEPYDETHRSIAWVPMKTDIASPSAITQIGIERAYDKAWGAKHATLGKAPRMTNLSSTIYDQGRWKKAEKLEVRVMETKVRLLELDHPSTLTGMANLTYTWKSKGRDLEALDLIKHAFRLEGQKRALDHSEAMNSALPLHGWLTLLEKGWCTSE